MGENVWTVLHRGREIRVASSTSWLPWKHRQSLEIDGSLINLHQDGLYSFPASLRSPHLFEGEELWVEAVIGYSGTTKACHIYVDGELVGGDTTQSIRALTHQQWQEIQRRGLGRFLLVRGPLYSVLFAPVLTIFSLMGLFSSQHLGVSFAVQCLVFGLGMGGFSWWALKQKFQGDH